MAYAKTDEDRQQLVGEIQSELKRLNRLINDVSNASRLDAELARQEMQAIDVQRVLESVSRIFRDMLDDDERSIKLVIDEAAPRSDFIVIGNDGRLGQVFTNLIDNALSFSPTGGRVTVTATSNGKWVSITIDDQGPGIPPDKLAAIFERFYSDRPATDTKRGKNSGLGLSISREIVVSHRGEIRAENLSSNIASNGNGFGNGAGTASVRSSINGASEWPAAGARFIVRLPTAHAGGGGVGGRRS